MAAGLTLDFIGSDELDAPELHQSTQVRFLNLRGDHRPNVRLADKIRRVGKYYLRLLRYAATAEAPIFHILWNNKLELFDRTVLTLVPPVSGEIDCLHRPQRQHPQA